MNSKAMNNRLFERLSVKEAENKETKENNQAHVPKGHTGVMDPAATRQRYAVGTLGGAGIGALLGIILGHDKRQILLNSLLGAGVGAGGAWASGRYLHDEETRDPTVGERVRGGLKAAGKHLHKNDRLASTTGRQVGKLIGNIPTSDDPAKAPGKGYSRVSDVLTGLSAGRPFLHHYLNRGKFTPDQGRYLAALGASRIDDAAKIVVKPLLDVENEIRLDAGEKALRMDNLTRADMMRIKRHARGLTQAQEAFLNNFGVEDRPFMLTSRGQEKPAAVLGQTPSRVRKDQRVVKALAARRFDSDTHQDKLDEWVSPKYTEESVARRNAAALENVLHEQSAEQKALNRGIDTSLKARFGRGIKDPVKRALLRIPWMRGKITPPPPPQKMPRGIPKTHIYDTPVSEIDDSTLAGRYRDYARKHPYKTTALWTLAAQAPRLIGYGKSFQAGYQAEPHNSFGAPEKRQ